MYEDWATERVKIDICHAELIYGLITSHKPKSILELGLGGGRSTDAILKALEYNSGESEFYLVDNWIDFQGKMPDAAALKYQGRMSIVTSDEKDFIFSTKQKFDFIMSDADHDRSDQWFEYVYENLLKPDGILIYHDINLFAGAFLNLRSILKICIRKNYNHFLFNKNSRPDERCRRGLLVIFKNRSFGSVEKAIRFATWPNYFASRIWKAVCVFKSRP
jgi:SAM-dependent methyltransferase